LLENLHPYPLLDPEYRLSYLPRVTPIDSLRKAGKSTMKKLFCLSFLALGMVATMSAMNSPVPESQKTINITPVTPSDAPWPDPRSPIPPYGK
jgi:hypothetical protein